MLLPIMAEINAGVAARPDAVAGYSVTHSIASRRVQVFADALSLHSRRHWTDTSRRRLAAIKRRWWADRKRRK